jgi:DNA polymerase-3 subunit epsilon
LSLLAAFRNRGRRVDAERPAGRGRWIVVDVETTGLDATRDRLVAVGALAVTDGAVRLDDAFDVVVRQATASSGANIEVHGIGGLEQAAGEAPAAVLERFLEFIGADPLVAWHAGFDARILDRAMREHLGGRFAPAWIDLAVLAPLAWPGRVPAGAALDDWAASLGIPLVHRHRAIVDCLATAQVLAAFLPHARRAGAATAGAMAALSGAGRWLGRSGFP